jgi:hypothetical protein
MMMTISEILKTEIPDEGLTCEVAGSFFYYLATDGMCPQPSRCFLSSSDSDSDVHIIALPPEVGKEAIRMDETFGMMVGGKYAYFAMPAVVSGTIRRQNGKLTFTRVSDLWTTPGTVDKFQPHIEARSNTSGLTWPK